MAGRNGRCDGYLPHDQNISGRRKIFSCRSAANISEAWRKRRYEAAFKSTLNDSEAEASETQTWIEVALRCSYIEKQAAENLDQKYKHILARLVTMSRDAGNWIL
jgi:four helix bundle protein